MLRSGDMVWRDLLAKMIPIRLSLDKNTPVVLDTTRSDSVCESLAITDNYLQLNTPLKAVAVPTHVWHVELSVSHIHLASHLNNQQMIMVQRMEASSWPERRELCEHFILFSSIYMWQSLPKIRNYFP